MTATPTRPTSTPPSLPAVRRSSRVSQWARRTVQSGAVALRTEARPPVILVWLQKIRLNGMTLLRRPMPAKASQRPWIARCWPVTTAASWRARAASATRARTRVRGGNSATATATNRNEPPHSTERTASSAHSVGVIVRAVSMLLPERRGPS